MSQLPESLSPPPAFRHSRGWLVVALGWAYLRLGCWKLEGTFPQVSKVVTIVAPHTSNWDFPLGVALLFALELRASWLGKHTLFQGPFGWLFYRLGGIPVDRRSSHGVVEACVKAFDDAPALLLALAPEGTRKGVSHWKSGFHAIATAARVPIMPVAFDFRTHVIHFLPLFHPTENLEEDLPRLQALFRDIHGLRERPTE